MKVLHGGGFESVGQLDTLTQLILSGQSLEFLLGQGFLIDYEAVVFPHQALDLVPMPVGEGVERTG